MAPSELGNWNSKGSCRRKYPLFSERLNAIHPVVKVLGHFLLTCYAGRQKSTSFRDIKIRYRVKLAAFGYSE